MTAAAAERQPLRSAVKRIQEREKSIGMCEAKDKKIQDENMDNLDSPESPEDVSGGTPDSADASEAETTPDAAVSPATDTAETPVEAEPVPVERQLEERAAECERLQDQLLRARADFDNYRKRLLREMEQVRQTASLGLIQKLLPVIDNLERALAHADANDGFVEGVNMVYKQFQDILGAEGLVAIPTVNETFDPNVHDALATMPSDNIESGVILDEYERGYMMHNNIVRPARVIVSSGPPETEATDEQEAPAQSPETETEENASSEE